MENSIAELYYTEKIIDCFLTGTVPIYWGTKRITDGFNKDGIIMLDDYLKNIDNFDYENLMSVLENEVVPMYYDNPEKWLNIVKKSMHDVYPYFDSDRMAVEYYQKVYQHPFSAVDKLLDSVFDNNNNG